MWTGSAASARQRTPAEAAMQAALPGDSGLQGSRTVSSAHHDAMHTGNALWAGPAAWTHQAARGGCKQALSCLRRKGCSPVRARSQGLCAASCTCELCAAATCAQRNFWACDHAQVALRSPWQPEKTCWQRCCLTARAQESVCVSTAVTACRPGLPAWHLSSSQHQAILFQLHASPPLPTPLSLQCHDPTQRHDPRP